MYLHLGLEEEREGENQDKDIINQLSKTVAARSKTLAEFGSSHIFL
jgi:hypothetical protein